MMKWTMGVDPGFGETGAVLSKGDEVLEWATWRCPPGAPAMQRACVLAEEVFSWMMERCEFHEIAHLDVAIERPIVGGRSGPANVEAFAKQMRLYQSLSQFVQFLPPDDLWLTEVYPTASKKLATGSGTATKQEVINALLRHRQIPGGLSTQEAIADAWAHGLAAWGVCDKCERIDLSRAADVRVDRVV